MSVEGREAIVDPDRPIGTSRHVPRRRTRRGVDDRGRTALVVHLLHLSVVLPPERRGRVEARGELVLRTRGDEPVVLGVGSCQIGIAGTALVQFVERGLVARGVDHRGAEASARLLALVEEVEVYTRSRGLLGHHTLLRSARRGYETQAEHPAEERQNGRDDRQEHSPSTMRLLAPPMRRTDDQSDQREHPRRDQPDPEVRPDREDEDARKQEEQPERDEPDPTEHQRGQHDERDHEDHDRHTEPQPETRVGEPARVQQLVKPFHDFHLQSPSRGYCLLPPFGERQVQDVLYKYALNPPLDERK